MKKQSSLPVKTGDQKERSRLVRALIFSEPVTDPLFSSMEISKPLMLPLRRSIGQMHKRDGNTLDVFV
jgi:hypothetical protein